LNSGRLFAIESTDTPKWISGILVIENTEDYYYGIGQSKKSQQDADLKARQEFILNVEVRVESVFKDKIQEHKQKSTETSSWSVSQVSEISLRGITITERYQEHIEKVIFNVIPKTTTIYYSVLPHE